MATWVGTVDADHKIISPEIFPVGEKVIIMQPLLISDLLKNPARRLRFIKTRKAIEQSMSLYDSSTAPSNEDIVKLVKQARKASKTCV